MPHNMTTIITAGSTICGVPKIQSNFKQSFLQFKTRTVILEHPLDWNGNSIINNNNITFNVGEEANWTLVLTRKVFFNI